MNLYIPKTHPPQNPKKKTSLSQIGVGGWVSFASQKSHPKRWLVSSQGYFYHASCMTEKPCWDEIYRLYIYIFGICKKKKANKRCYTTWLKDRWLISHSPMSLGLSWSRKQTNQSPPNLGVAGLAIDPFSTGPLNQPHLRMHQNETHLILRNSNEGNNGQRLKYWTNGSEFRRSPVDMVLVSSFFPLSIGFFKNLKCCRISEPSTVSHFNITVKAPENRPFAPNGHSILVFQPSIFQGQAVTFREGKSLITPFWNSLRWNGLQNGQPQKQWKRMETGNIWKLVHACANINTYMYIHIYIYIYLYQSKYKLHMYTHISPKKSSILPTGPQNISSAYTANRLPSKNATN